MEPDRPLTRSLPLLVYMRRRFDALTPEQRALSFAVLSALAFAVAAVALFTALNGPSRTGLLSGEASPSPTDGPGVKASSSPEPSFSPSPLPEASVVAVQPAPEGSPPASVIVEPVAPAATRAPATPVPTPDPAVWRVEGVIIEKDTKLPIEQVCVVIGPHGCQRGSIRTDSRGVFFIDVPQVPTVFYDLYFVKDGFAPVWMRIKPEGPGAYNVALTKR